MFLLYIYIWKYLFNGTTMLIILQTQTGMRKKKEKRIIFIIFIVLSLFI